MSEKQTYDFLIVGAGLFGAVFARQVTDAGYTCLVIDKRNHIAGNTFTKEVEGIQVHQYGAHIFHTNDKVIWDYVNRFATFNDYRHKVQVNYKNQLLSFPINLKTFEQLYGISSPEEAIKHLESVRVKSANNDFESWALSQIGEDLYKTFVNGYTEKQWGRPAKELPSSILKRIPIRTERNNNYFNDAYQGIPIGGYTKMIERMLQGIEVRLGVDYFEQREELSQLATKTVFTGPIDAFYDYRFGALAYRSLDFQSEVRPMEYVQQRAVVNYTDADVPFTRIIEHKHFDKVNTPHTVLTKEYPVDWNRGKEPYYPINDNENKALYLRYKALSENDNKVMFGGRLGEYKYYDMHQVIGSALAKSSKYIEENK